MAESLADRIDSVLPQTQCRECGYSGCRPYAEALSQGKAPLSLCRPGGESALQAIAQELSLDPQPYLAEVLTRYKPPSTVRIDAQQCIGCTKCIQACPVDAIIGAPRQMHAILTEYCTGCDLCIAPCPVDCIHPVEGITSSLPERERAQRSRTRYMQRQLRQQQEQKRQRQAYQEAQRWVAMEYGD